MSTHGQGHVIEPPSYTSSSILDTAFGRPGGLATHRAEACNSKDKYRYHN